MIIPNGRLVHCTSHRQVGQNENPNYDTGTAFSTLRSKSVMTLPQCEKPTYTTVIECMHACMRRTILFNDPITLWFEI